MADVVWLASSVIQIVDLATKVLARTAALTAAAGVRYRRARFGPFGNLIYLLGLVDTDALQELHFKINTWSDAQAIAWKDSQLATCNAIAVASAIFASIGLTALQLPNIDAVHWSARALCASSMVLGILSVTMATSQYQALGQLNDALTVRLWLSRGRPTRYLSRLRLLDLLDPDRARAEDRSKYQETDPFDKLPLESSITSLIVIALPRHLLDLSVLLFIVGFGLYSLFLWRDNVNEAGLAYRNAFIIFVITVGIVVVYWIFLAAFMTENENIKAEQFALRTLRSGWNRADEIRELEKKLLICQSNLQFMRDLEEDSLPSGSERSASQEDQGQQQDAGRPQSG